MLLTLYTSRNSTCLHFFSHFSEAKPKKIWELMNVPGLTLAILSSYLQVCFILIWLLSFIFFHDEIFFFFFWIILRACEILLLLYAVTFSVLGRTTRSNFDISYICQGGIFFYSNSFLMILIIFSYSK
jgi:hypothetical protein